MIKFDLWQAESVRDALRLGAEKLREQAVQFKKEAETMSGSEQAWRECRVGELEFEADCIDHLAFSFNNCYNGIIILDEDRDIALWEKHCE